MKLTEAQRRVLEESARAESWRNLASDYSICMRELWEHVEMLKNKTPQVTSEQVEPVE